MKRSLLLAALVVAPCAVCRVSAHQESMAARGRQASLRVRTWESTASDNGLTISIMPDRLVIAPSDTPCEEIKSAAVLVGSSPKGLFLRCQRLQVHTSSGGKPGSLRLEAKGHVEIRWEEIHAVADTVCFDEAKDRLILVSGPKGKAILTKRRKGETPLILQGKKIDLFPNIGKAWAYND